MPSIFRGTQAQVNRSDLSGRRVWKGAAVANWWDPNNVDLSIAGAYRAIRSVGTPWGGGPTAYAQTLVNQANPGVNDLVEGNGAVPWVQATGWDFVAASVQYFDTGLVPVNDQSWSALIQFATMDTTVLAVLLGARGGASRVLQLLNFANVQVQYANGGFANRPPVLGTGNLGVLGRWGFRNGIIEGAAIGAWIGASVHSIYIGCRNNVGVPNLFVTADIESIAIYNGGAAAVRAEAAAIAAAMAAL